MSKHVVACDDGSPGVEVVVSAESGGKENRIYNKSQININR
jgi:hypothetical protein